MDRLALASLWAECARINRTHIFGTADPLRPDYPNETPLRMQIDTPAVGMVGGGYASGGTVMLSVNPAGGSIRSTALPSSDHLYDAFTNLRNCSLSDAAYWFECVNQRFLASLPDWTITQQYIAPIFGRTVAPSAGCRLSLSNSIQNAWRHWQHYA